MSKELKKYIELSLQKGSPKEQIKENLLQAGWSKSLVEKSLLDYAGVDSTGVIIPAPKQQFNQIMKDIFVYCISFITLTMSSVSIINIMFKFADFVFQDQLVGDRYYHSDITGALAQLIVAFPVYVFLCGFLSKDLVAFPEKRESLVRKLMVYFILLITSVTAIIDLTYVLTNFFSGELTANTFSKSMLVFAVMGIIFSYYFGELKNDENFTKGKA